MKTVLVVCRGNIARSPVAEFFLNSKITNLNLKNKIQVFSRGTQGTPIDPQPVKFPSISYYSNLYREAKPALEKLGIDISMHISQPINEADAKNADVILVVDTKTRNAVETLFPNFKNKVHTLSELVGKDEDFPDPENITGTEKHLKVFEDIRDTIEAGFSKLLSLLQA